MKDSALIYSIVDSPIGALLLTSRGGPLCGLYMEPHEGPYKPAPDWRRDDNAFRAARDQLAAYFAGTLRRFQLPLAFVEGTEFQRRVWYALLEIPYGETISYADLAGRIGAAKAVRAVGAANGRNPISIVVPCHRVIGSNGSLTGYGGGLPRKRWLLEHERMASAGLFGAARLHETRVAPEPARSS
jgi:methylated-DNA-[protein]-cysteine S-methyltransferase